MTPMDGCQQLPRVPNNILSRELRYLSSELAVPVVEVPVSALVITEACFFPQIRKLGTT